MTWLYVLLVAIVCAAVPLTVWLKRAGDREWQAHLLARTPRRIVLNITPDTARFEAAMREAARAVERMGRELSRVAEEIQPAVQQLARDLNRKGNNL